VSWQQQVFGPMAERTMANAQRRHLVCCYDLARDSRLAAAIVAEVNRVLDQEERRRGVQRVRPGELLLRTHRGPLVLPLRTDEDLGRVLAGERFDLVRRDILDRCAQAYRGLFPEASTEQTAAFLRCVWAGRGPRGRTTASPLYGPRRGRPWPTDQAVLADGAALATLDAERGRHRADRDPPRPAHQPATYTRLAHYLGTQAGIPPPCRSHC
jgi:hypothetical protein